jgi:hypothetical protein
MHTKKNSRKDAARRSRNQRHENLTQRRKGKTKKNLPKTERFPRIALQRRKGKTKYGIGAKDVAKADALNACSGRAFHFAPLTFHLY